MRRFAAALAASHYLRSYAPEGSAGLGMLPGLAQSWTTAVLCTLPFMAKWPTARDWKRRRGRPAHTWTRTVEADLKPANIGLFSACHRAQDRSVWSGLIRTTMPQSGASLLMMM